MGAPGAPEPPHLLGKKPSKPPKNVVSASAGSAGVTVDQCPEPGGRLASGSPLLCPGEPRAPRLGLSGLESASESPQGPDPSLGVKNQLV